MTTSDKAVRKASHERLLRDFARAARVVSIVRRLPNRGREYVLQMADSQTSRTRYACLMTAFGR